MRRALAPSMRHAAGAAVRDHLMADPRIQAASRVALYAALPDEVPTRPLFDALATADRIRLLPRLGPAARRLEFAVVESWEALRRGPHGVLAPPAEAPSVALEPTDVAVVPGVAFDPAGRRLGRGAGYYDRTFPPGRPAPLLIGVAFRIQLVPEVPGDSRDRAVDAIVTEDGLRDARGVEPPGGQGSR